MYQELTDDEWALIAPLVEEIMGTPKGGRGRPRSPNRLCCNGVLHCITDNTTLSSSAGKLNYPSNPTLHRFYKSMTQTHALSIVIKLLSDTRPQLQVQFDNYYPTTQNATKQLKRGAGFVFPLGHLPWGPPGKLVDDCNE